MAGVNDNFTPVTKENAAEMGRRGGLAKKGSKHLSTLIRELSEDIDWDKTNLKNKEELNRRYGKNGWLAIVYVAFSKAMAGDTKAMDWLAKYGFADGKDPNAQGDTYNTFIQQNNYDPRTPSAQELADSTLEYLMQKTGRKERKHVTNERVDGESNPEQAKSGRDK